MNVKYFLIPLFFTFLAHQSDAQGVGISQSPVTPDPSAMLDISGASKGVLINRMTVAERDAIVSPAPSLLIYNTTAKCFEFWENNMWQTLGCAACPTPAQPSAISGNNSPCAGSSQVYAVNGVNGVTYSWTFPSGWVQTAGENSNSVTVTAGTEAGIVQVTPSNSCGNGSAQSLSVSPLAVPASPVAGTHSASQTDITWNWNASAGASGYRYHTANDYNGAADIGPSTSYLQSGLTCNEPASLYVWAYNACGHSSPALLTQSTASCMFVCGSNVSFTYKGAQVSYGTVQSNTGRCWLDRNLGATQVATALNDANAFGDLFQWGRLDDGHQTRTTTTTGTLSNTDVPGHALFIVAPNSPNDWRAGQNNDLWQGVSGINNPCPAGFRVPTEAELTAERNSWSPLSGTGGFNSPLKWTAGGTRDLGTATLSGVGSSGYYWTSTVNSLNASNMDINSGSANFYANRRSRGMSVRCIRD
jgi:hypothetical protein